MKKIVSLLFGGLLSISLLSGCNNSNEENPTQDKTSEATSQTSTSEDERYRIYLLALDAGYEGTYEEWLESIKGAKGDKGDKGDTGEKGEDGTSLRYGEGLPSNELGNNGDCYIDFSTWNFYVKEDGHWILKGNLMPEIPVVYHTVTFDTDEGSAIAPQQVKHGEKIIKPDDPVKTGYDFTYWSLGDEKWSFIGYVVTEDITLKANYSLIYYDIEFYDDQDNLIYAAKDNYFSDFETEYPYVYYPVCNQSAPLGKFYAFDKWIMDRNEDTRLIKFTPSYVLKDLSFGDYVKIDEEMYPIDRQFRNNYYIGNVTINNIDVNKVLEFYLNGVKLNLESYQIINVTDENPVDDSFKVLYPLDSLSVAIDTTAGNNIYIVDVESSHPEPIPGYEWHYLSGLEDWLFEDDYEVVALLNDGSSTEFFKIEPDSHYLKIPTNYSYTIIELDRVYKDTTMPSYDIWKDLPGKTTHTYNLAVDQRSFVLNIDNDKWITSYYNASIGSTIEEVYEIGKALPNNTSSEVTYRVNGYVYSCNSNEVVIASKMKNFVTSSDKLIKVPLYPFASTYAEDTYLQVTSFVHHGIGDEVEMKRVVDSNTYYAGFVVLEESSSITKSNFGLVFKGGRIVRGLKIDTSTANIRNFEFDAGDCFKLYDANTEAQWAIPLSRITVSNGYYNSPIDTSLLFEIEGGYIKVKSSFISSVTINLVPDNDSLRIYAW